MASSHPLRMATATAIAESGRPREADLEIMGLPRPARSHETVEALSISIRNRRDSG